MKYLWLPNILTSTRILLTPVFLYYLFSDFSHGKLFAFCVFAIASITDAYDGKIARKYNLETKIGVFLDPLADKFLVLSAFYGFMYLPVLDTTIKLWMIILISFRDILVTLLRMIMQYKGITMITSKVSKIKTALQIITIHSILLYLILVSYQIGLSELIINFNILYIFMLLTTVTTFYTGLHYFFYNYKILGNLFFNK